MFIFFTVKVSQRIKKKAVKSAAGTRPTRVVLKRVNATRDVIRTGSIPEESRHRGRVIRKVNRDGRRGDIRKRNLERDRRHGID